MYIGPWQEYKLASVIRLKNDIYQGNVLNSPKLTEQALIQHNNRTFTTDSNSTERSFISDNIQMKYPKFNLDTYYKQWRHVEQMISKTENNEILHKKPLVQKNYVRKRYQKNFQAQRINKMRDVYGLNDKEELKLPVIEKHNVKSPEKPKERLVLPSIYPKKKEEIEEDQVDNLLQWVKELPEELSVNSSEASTHNLQL